MTLESAWLQWRTQILIVEESKVSWEINPLALACLALCSNQLGQVCAALCAVDSKLPLKWDKVCLLVGFHWCLIGWPTFSSLFGIFLLFAPNAPHLRNLLMLGKPWQVVALVPITILLQLWWRTALGFPPCPSLILQYLYFSLPPYFCCNYVGKTLNKL